jgi:Arc/MetJ-type ribon-helix-helix transcriptional regulator
MNKTILVIAALSLISVLGISMVAGFGFGGNLSDEEREERIFQREEIRKSVESGDFESWQELMNERIEHMKAGITQENFEALREKHQQIAGFREAVQKAREAGELDRDRLKELAEEYEVGNGRFAKVFKRGFRAGIRNCPMTG